MGSKVACSHGTDIVAASGGQAVGFFKPTTMRTHQLTGLHHPPLEMRIKHAKSKGRGDGPLHKVAREEPGETGLPASPQSD